MKFFFWLFFTACVGTAAYGQGNVAGKVFDQKHQPAAFVTVTLASATDSLSSQTTADGAYLFAKVKPARYKIIVHYIGYVTSQSPIFEVKDDNINLQNIIIKPDTRQLNEVVINGRKSLIQQRADKLVVNVQNSVFAAGASAADILRKVPGIRVLNDRIVMPGKNKPMIMVDDRIAQYQDLSVLLKSLPANDIEKIEVINNPSAKYDAEGDAVINIVLKRKHAGGTNATLSLASGLDPYDMRSVNQGNKIFPHYSPSVSINHQSGMVNIFASYNYVKRSQFEVNLINRYFGNSFYDQKNYNSSQSSTHNYQVGMDVKADSLNNFGFTISGFNRNNEGSFLNNSQQLNRNNGGPIDAFNSTNEQEGKNTNIVLTLNWRHNFNKTGSSLAIDADAAHYLLRNRNLITVYPQNDPVIENFQSINTPVNFQTLKADYAYPFNKTYRLEAGAKTSFATIDNNLFFEVDGLPKPSRDNKFLYKENINAAYGNLYASYQNWDLQAGLRAEQTDATGTSDSRRVLKRNYIQFFPSLLITRKLDTTLAITGQLGRRIGRPSYLQQNPFEVYLDPLTYTKGNPLLRPQTTNSAKISLTYTGLPVLSLAYDHTRNVIVDYAPQQQTIIDANGKPQLVSFSVADNLARSDNFTGQLNFPIKAGNVVDGYGGLITTFQRYNAFYQGALFKANKWNYTFFAQADIKMSSSLLAQVSAYYATPSQYEFIRAGKNSSVDIGLAKKLLGDKAKIGLSVADIFWQDKTLGSIMFKDIDVRLRQYTNTRNITVSFTYNLGMKFKKQTDSHTSGAEDEINRVKTE